MLLRNDNNTLPFAPSSSSKVAVVGPNANSSVVSRDIRDISEPEIEMRTAFKQGASRTNEAKTTEQTQGQIQSLYRFSSNNLRVGTSNRDSIVLLTHFSSCHSIFDHHFIFCRWVPLIAVAKYNARAIAVKETETEVERSTILRSGTCISCAD